MEDSPMKTFGGIYKLRNLIKEPTCFKNPDNPISYCQASLSDCLADRDMAVWLSQNDSGCYENAFS